jgi:hypothetical protein
LEEGDIAHEARVCLMYLRIAQSMDRAVLSWLDMHIAYRKSDSLKSLMHEVAGVLTRSGSKLEEFNA